ncbi:MAG: exodeoxyribonuclease VII large subunit, partial [Gammaproteobacteria bacterium]|nr:exodeoxyribonuclease VII large subunit [Gammaproteobacteria bacterium]
QFGLITVCGEISAFTRARSGHWYFTLKDIEGQIRCAMFRKRNLYCQFQPKEGDLVHLQAKVSIYPDRGEYQLIGEQLTPAGAGQLQAAFQQLKQKLQDEGLFAAERKQAIPEHCQRIAVITSANGAAVHDIISVAGKRMPSLQIDILPVAVQGPDAAPGACRAIELCNIAGLHDAIIIARGGGSMEDLWSFNDESLARYIANSAIPVISAVGHETDFTISDFVADLRAPTPSAAAEAITQNQQHLGLQAKQLGQRLQRAMHNTLRQQKLVISQLKAQVRKPDQQLQDYTQRLDKLSMTLEKHMEFRLYDNHRQLDRLHSRIQSLSPKAQITLQRQHLGNLSERASKSMHSKHHHSTDQLAHLAGMLNQLSPLQTLTRGYAIAQDKQGNVVTKAAQVTSGQALKVRWQDGTVTVTAN